MFLLLFVLASVALAQPLPSCPGYHSMSISRAKALLGPGNTQVLLGEAVLGLATRNCNNITGCGDWNVVYGTNHVPLECSGFGILCDQNLWLEVVDGSIVPIIRGECWKNCDIPFSSIETSPIVSIVSATCESSVGCGNATLYDGHNRAALKAITTASAFSVGYLQGVITDDCFVAHSDTLSVPGPKGSTKQSTVFYFVKSFDVQQTLPCAQDSDCGARCDCPIGGGFCFSPGDSCIDQDDCTGAQSYCYTRQSQSSVCGSPCLHQANVTLEEKAIFLKN